MTDFVLFNSGTKDNWSKVLNLGKQHQSKVWLTAKGDATVYAQKKRDGKKKKKKRKKKQTTDDEVSSCCGRLVFPVRYHASFLVTIYCVFFLKDYQISPHKL